ncbi:MAG: hypothetical protein DWH81_08930 [Planctomycetota bacterium]|nr:MAG: hypothetical protein DWH81_08930 [Planctomycetota bacterium]
MKGPQTLADVPIGTEEPVLCWVNSSDIRPLEVFEGTIYATTEDGDSLDMDPPASQYKLYQPLPSPKQLADLPDRRVILAPATAKLLNMCWFKENGEWWMATQGHPQFLRENTLEPDKNNWKLTDLRVELQEIEVKV